jgi:hypothetical protein
MGEWKLFIVSEFLRIAQRFSAGLPSFLGIKVPQGTAGSSFVPCGTLKGRGASYLKCWAIVEVGSQMIKKVPEPARRIRGMTQRGNKKKMAEPRNTRNHTEQWDGREGFTTKYTNHTKEGQEIVKGILVKGMGKEV